MQYLGDWYQVQGIPSFFQPADAHCVRATYSRRDDTSINVRNIGIFSNEDKEICGHADSKDPSNPAQLKLYFPGTPEGDYWVLDTDYENWSAVYSCGDIFGLIKFEYAFALTRTPDPSAEVVSLILSKKSLENIQITSCFCSWLLWIRLTLTKECLWKSSFTYLNQLTALTTMVSAAISKFKSQKLGKNWKIREN